MKKWDDYIKQQEDDLNDYESDLNALYLPFDGLNRKYKGEDNFKQAPQVKKPPMTELDNVEFVEHKPEIIIPASKY